MSFRRGRKRARRIALHAVHVPQFDDGTAGDLVVGDGRVERKGAIELEPKKDGNNHHEQAHRALIIRELPAVDLPKGHEHNPDDDEREEEREEVVVEVHDAVDATDSGKERDVEAEECAELQVER